MGLDDFYPHTQDLIAVEGLRQCGAIDFLILGDMPRAIRRAAKTWGSLPLERGASNRVKGQPYTPYDKVIEIFKRNGGTVND